MQPYFYFLSVCEKAEEKMQSVGWLFVVVVLSLEFVDLNNVQLLWAFSKWL